jgi:hypothetical protein
VLPKRRRKKKTTTTAAKTQLCTCKESKKFKILLSLVSSEYMEGEEGVGG